MGTDQALAIVLLIQVRNRVLVLGVLSSNLIRQTPLQLDLESQIKGKCKLVVSKHAAPIL